MASLVVHQGADEQIEVPGVVDVSGTAVDPVGCSVQAQVRKWTDSDEVLHEWSTSLGNATIETGRVLLTIPAAVSSAWDWDQGVFDVELTDPAGKVARIAEGRIFLSRETTR